MEGLWFWFSICLGGLGVLASWTLIARKMFTGSGQWQAIGVACAAILLVSWSPLGYLTYRQHNQEASLRTAAQDFATRYQAVGNKIQLQQVVMVPESYVFSFLYEGSPFGAIRAGELWLEFPIRQSQPPAPPPAPTDGANGQTTSQTSEGNAEAGQANGQVPATTPAVEKGDGKSK